MEQHELALASAFARRFHQPNAELKLQEKLIIQKWDEENEVHVRYPCACRLDDELTYVYGQYMLAKLWCHYSLSLRQIAMIEIKLKYFDPSHFTSK